MEEKEKDTRTPEESAHDLYTFEMGFSLVVEAMIEAKKPIIGHNCMYDWLYTYN